MAWMESSEDLTEAMRSTPADRPVPVASTGKARYTVTVARTVEELAGLRGAWESLQGSAVTTDPDHYLTVLRSDPRFRMPHVVLLEDDGVPAAMVIGRIADIRVSCKFGYKTISASAPRAQRRLQRRARRPGRGPRGLLIRELEAALDRGEADVAYLPNFRASSRLVTLARTRPSVLCRQHVSEEKLHWRVPIPSSIDELLRSQSKHTRQNLATTRAASSARSGTT